MPVVANCADYHGQSTGQGTTNACSLLRIAVTVEVRLSSCFVSFKAQEWPDVGLCTIRIIMNLHVRSYVTVTFEPMFVCLFWLGINTLLKYWQEVTKHTRYDKLRTTVGSNKISTSYMSEGRSLEIKPTQIYCIKTRCDRSLELWGNILVSMPMVVVKC